MKAADEKTGTDIIVRLEEAVNTFRLELGDALIDILDAGMGSLFVDEFLNNLPWVKTLLGLMKFGISIDNLLFIKKVQHFLFEFNDPREEKERQKFLNKLREEAPFRQRVEENLILVLHRLDDMQKPTLLARVFRAHYVTHKIDYRTFQKLRTAVERIKPYNIQDLLDYYNARPDVDHLPSNEDLQDLAYCGLVSFASGSGMWFQANDEPIRNFSRNEYGTLFIEIALEQNIAVAH